MRQDKTKECKNYENPDSPITKSHIKVYWAILLLGLIILPIMTFIIKLFSIDDKANTAIIFISGTVYGYIVAFLPKVIK